MGKITLGSIKIKDIKEYLGNAKIHTDEQIGKLVDSMISFGYCDPIAVDENNEIIEGHGRLIALKRIFSDPEKEIEVIIINGLEDDQKKAYRIAHNKINLDTGFDLDVLGKEFNNLEDTDFFQDTGFSIKEITEIWDMKESKTEITEHNKSTTFKHTCPDCGHEWEETREKQNKTTID